MNNINFNFTDKQEEKYNIILNETKLLYPDFFKDKIIEHKIKVLIANNIINEN